MNKKRIFSKVSVFLVIASMMMQGLITSFAEEQMKNVALGKQAKAYDSSFYKDGNNVWKDGFGANKAFDGKKSDTERWVSATDSKGPQYLEVDLVAESTIASAIITTSKGYALKATKLQYLLNNNWVDIPGSSLPNDWNKVNPAKTVAFSDKIEATKVRLVVEGDGNIRIQELELMGFSQASNEQQNNILTDPGTTFMYDDFEDDEIGSQPDINKPSDQKVWDTKYIAFNEEARVIKDGENNVFAIRDKYNKRTNYATKSIYDFLWQGKSIIKFRLKLDDDISRFLVYLNNMEMKVTTDARFLEFKNGQIYCLGTAESQGKYQNNIWYDVTIDVSYGEKTFSVNMKDEKGEEINISDKQWKTDVLYCALNLIVESKSPEANVYLDDLKIYREKGTNISTEPAPRVYVDEKPIAPLKDLSAATLNPNRLSDTTKVSALKTIEAEECYSYYGLQPSETFEGENGTKGGTKMSNGHPNDFMYFKNVDFGDGVKGFEARVSTQHVGGTLQIRLDKVDGPNVGILTVRNTGDYHNFETQACEISEVKGVHDVFLVWGVSTTWESQLFDVNWFRFTKNVPEKLASEKFSVVEDKNTALRDNLYDTWVATDDLGRVVSTNDEVGFPRQDKTVGIFYFTHFSRALNEPIIDVTEEEKKDFYFPIQKGKLHWWAQPQLGYYMGTDEFVIRKHMQMINDAGVDFLIVDLTNGLPYENEYRKIFEVCQKMRNEGIKTPQIAFFCSNEGLRAKIGVVHLYDNIYKKGLYKDLWFMWEGKPLILSNPIYLSDEIKSFFTIRYAWAWSKSDWFGDGEKRWTWLDDVPQNYGWTKDIYTPEQLSVTLAQHVTTSIGKSYSNGKEPSREEIENGNLSAKGIYAQAQWNNALKVDPRVIMVTGWNEWFAGGSAASVDYPSYANRGLLKKGEGMLVDQYNTEFNRDIEPMKDGYRDNYYYQLVDNVRKFKGAREIPTPSGLRTIEINNDFTQWKDVSPEFLDDVNDTMHRDHIAFQNNGKYTNESGRNDFDTAKVSYDKDNVYFYIKTVDDITKPEKANWMTLYLDTAKNSDKNWYGYEFALNRVLKDEKTGILEKSNGGNNWQAVGEVNFVVDKNQMHLAIPRKILGLENVEKVSLDFKWADNSAVSGDIMDFIDQGDTAPNSRFNYRLSAGTGLAEYSDSVMLFINKPNSIIKGRNKPIDSSNSSIAPFIRDGRTMVPLRFIAEGFDAKVDWNGEEKSVTISVNGNTIKMVIGEKNITSNGINKEIDVAPVIEGERTFVPIRFFVETLGKNVFWDNRGLVIISEKEKIFNADNDKAIIDKAVNMFGR